MVRIVFIILCFLYIISPYDLAPDVFPGIGWIDDLMVMGLLYWFVFHRESFPFKGFFRPSSPRQDAESEPQTNTVSPKTAYEILDIPPDAPLPVVKKAYRELAGKYHPDKVSHLGEEFRILAEMRFKEIQNAYEQIISTRK